MTNLALSCKPLLQLRLMIFLRTKLLLSLMKRRRLCFAGEVEASQCPAAPPPIPQPALVPLRFLKPLMLLLTMMAWRLLTPMLEKRLQAAAGLPVCSERIKPTAAGSSVRL